MRDLSTIQGTIAHALTQNKDAIYALLNQGKVYEAKVEAIRTLDTLDANCKNPKVNQAKAQMLRAKNANHFLSILATYMTGLKVS